MGRFKRKKGKPKKVKRFVNVDMVLNLIKENFEIFETLPDTTIQIEKREIDEGDEWDSEVGYEYIIAFSDKSVYLVGKSTKIEDREYYAQADSWEVTDCMDLSKQCKTPPLEVLEKLEKIIENVN